MFKDESPEVSQGIRHWCLGHNVRVPLPVALLTHNEYMWHFQMMEMLMRVLGIFRDGFCECTNYEPFDQK